MLSRQGGCNSGKSTTGRTTGSSTGLSASLYDRHGCSNTTGRATGSCPSTSPKSACPRTSSRSSRTVEVITISSSESSDEDLEVIAARLRKAKCLRKSQRKYMETNKSQVEIRRRIFESRVLSRKDEEITQEEESRNTSKRGATGRITGSSVCKYKKMGMIRSSH